MPMWRLEKNMKMGVDMRVMVGECSTRKTKLWKTRHHLFINLFGGSTLHTSSASTLGTQQEQWGMAPLTF